MARTEPSPPLRHLQPGWLLLLAACSWAPLLPYLPLWLSALSCLLLLWHGVLCRRQTVVTSKPHRLLLTLLALGGAAAIIAHYQGMFGRNLGVALLALLLPLKLHEARSRRDGLVLVCLAAFLMLSQFIYNQNFLAALLMLLGVMALLGALQSLHQAQQAVRPMLRLAGRWLLQALPLALLLFLIFPRLQGPLWGLPEDAFSARSGLSDHMAPGSISQLSLSDAIAFRVDFQQAGPRAAQLLPARDQLYWRGPVLSKFDGYRWQQGPNAPLATLPYPVTGPQLNYTVTLEPSNQRWLFVLERPAMIPSDARLQDDLQLVTAQAIRARQRYQASSLRSPWPGWQAEVPAARLASDLQLPLQGNPKARQLAADWAQAAPKEPRARAEALIRRMLRYLREQPFHYTLQPPLLGADSIDEFLFLSRRGFCEHYAASFVFMMRAAGVPARVVTGYQGGEINPNDGTLIVRQSDAHAWAEVWLAGSGWQRVDPTAAIAPERIELNLAQALSPVDRQALPLIWQPQYAWLHAARLRLDALANHWNQWVIGYNQQRQRQIFRHFGVDSGDWQQLALGFALLSAFLVLAVLGWSWHLRPRIEPLQRLWLRFCRRMARQGWPREPWEGPQAYGERLYQGLCASQHQGSQQKAFEARSIAALYAQLRYAADTLTAAKRQQLFLELRQRLARYR